MTDTCLPARKLSSPGLGVLAGMLLLLFCNSTSVAANFTVSPVFQEVPPDSGIAVFEVRNRGSRPLSFQVQAFAWSQRGGRDVRQPAKDLLIVPPVVSVDPGDVQLIRIALRDSDRANEHAYRVVVRELPQPGDPADGFALKTLLAFDVPLFFAASDAERELDWRLVQTAQGGLAIQLNNTGTRHARFTGIRVLGKDGRELAAVKGLNYVLAGADHSWKVPVSGSIRRGTPVTLVYSMTGQENSVPLKVE